MSCSNRSEANHLSSICYYVYPFMLTIYFVLKLTTLNIVNAVTSFLVLFKLLMPLRNCHTEALKFSYKGIYTGCRVAPRQQVTCSFYECSVSKDMVFQTTDGKFLTIEELCQVI
jgi:hypothetical protein